jgi:hypothetical protein
MIKPTTELGKQGEQLRLSDSRLLLTVPWQTSGDIARLQPAARVGKTMES